MHVVSTIQSSECGHTRWSGGDVRHKVQWWDKFILRSEVSCEGECA